MIVAGREKTHEAAALCRSLALHNNSTTYNNHTTNNNTNTMQHVRRRRFRRRSCCWSDVVGVLLCHGLFVCFISTVVTQSGLSVASSALPRNKQLRISSEKFSPPVGRHGHRINRLASEDRRALRQAHLGGLRPDDIDSARAGLHQHGRELVHCGRLARLCLHVPGHHRRGPRTAAGEPDLCPAKHCLRHRQGGPKDLRLQLGQWFQTQGLEPFFFVLQCTGSASGPTAIGTCRVA